MIGIDLQGGLGNQLFQYAAGLAVAQRNDGRLLLNMRLLRRDPKRRLTLDAYPIRAQVVDSSLLRPPSRLQRWAANAGWLSGSLRQFPFNAPMFENLYGMVERFHVEHVLAGVPPPADGSSRYEEFLKKVYPVARRPPIIADAETNERLLRFAKLKEASDRLKRALKLERNELVRIIGDTSGITSLEYGTLSYKHTKDRLLVDWRKAASDFQIVAALLVKRLPVEARPAVEARLKAIIPEHTKTKRGHRMMLTKWHGDAALELARLNLTLDALEAGEDEDEEQEDPQPKDEE